MDFLTAIFYGAVQGATEFLPVSSSGHLVVLHRFWPLEAGEALPFDVALHTATLLAVIYYYRRDYKNLSLAWIKSFFRPGGSDSRLAWLIVITTCPALLAGLLLGNFLERVRGVEFVIAALIVVGLALIFIDRFAKGAKALAKLRWPSALFIGLMQVLAFVPGVSRSGITIIAGLMAGVGRAEAVRFSFLMSAPIILAASVKELPALFAGPGLGAGEAVFIAAAFLTAFVSGLWAIGFLTKFTANNRLVPFGLYRLALATALLVIMSV